MEQTAIERFLIYIKQERLRQIGVDAVVTLERRGAGNERSCSCARGHRGRNADKLVIQGRGHCGGPEMNYHEAISRAIDIQAHIRALQADFSELISIEPNNIQIGWEAFSVLFPNDAYLEAHFIHDGYEHKRGWYNGAHIVTCREVKPDEA